MVCHRHRSRASFSNFAYATDTINMFLLFLKKNLLFYEGFFGKPFWYLRNIHFQSNTHVFIRAIDRNLKLGVLPPITYITYFKKSFKHTQRIPVTFNSYKVMCKAWLAMCDSKLRVAMCGCEPILLKLVMCVHAVHFQACDVRSQLRKFLSNDVSYED